MGPGPGCGLQCFGPCALPYVLHKANPEHMRCTFFLFWLLLLHEGVGQASVSIA
jgi:hypothetical protein